MASKLTNRNPEIDAKIDKFMADHPKQVDDLNKLNKDDLVRIIMKDRVDRQEQQNKRNQYAAEYVAKRPKVQAQIDKRVNSYMNPSEKTMKEFEKKLTEKGISGEELKDKLEARRNPSKEAGEKFRIKLNQDAVREQSKFQRQNATKSL